NVKILLWIEDEGNRSTQPGSTRSLGESAAGDSRTARILVAAPAAQGCRMAGSAGGVAIGGRPGKCALRGGVPDRGHRPRPEGSGGARGSRSRGSQGAAGNGLGARSRVR